VTRRFDSDPCVSVVMANYNGERHLEAAALSVLGQSCRNLELLIVDDASTDGGLAIAERLESQDARVRVLRQPANAGPAAARNRGLAEARGRWIAVHDSDDLAHPSRLERLVAEAETSGADIIVDNMVVFYDDGGTASHRFLKSRGPLAKAWISAPDYIESGALFTKRPAFGPLKPVLRASSLRASGLQYDERLKIGEDFDLVARCLLAGLTLRLDSCPYYFYRKHGASISHRLKSEEILAMQRAAASLPPGDGSTRLRQAARRYQASLKTAFAFSQAIEAMKQRRVSVALRTLIGEPRAMLKLSLPIGARLRRLRRAIAPALGRVKPVRGESEHLIALTGLPLFGTRME